MRTYAREADAPKGWDVWPTVDDGISALGAANFMTAFTAAILAVMLGVMVASVGKTSGIVFYETLFRALTAFHHFPSPSTTLAHLQSPSTTLAHPPSPSISGALTGVWTVSACYRTLCSPVNTLYTPVNLLTTLVHVCTTPVHLVALLLGDDGLHHPAALAHVDPLSLSIPDHRLSRAAKPVQPQRRRCAHLPMPHSWRAVGGLPHAQRPRVHDEEQFPRAHEGRAGKVDHQGRLDTARGGEARRRASRKAWRHGGWATRWANGGLTEVMSCPSLVCSHLRPRSKMNVCGARACILRSDRAMTSRFFRHPVASPRNSL